MLIYRGMDVGTDKPGAAERRRVHYGGIDLADPDESFSVGDYVVHARETLRRAAECGRTVLVVGGTGLYVKCLTEGLDRLPSADESLRTRAESLLEKEGVGALQRELRSRDPGRFERLADRKNPRRLVRALELAVHGADAQKSWSAVPPGPLAGLRMDAEDLRERIGARVRRMYESGLLEEARRLAAQYDTLSATALQAIGYAEAFAVLKDEMNVEEATVRTVTRTRQLAKRQMTWFRHQARVEWIEVGRGEGPASVAEKVFNVWRTYGPTPVNLGA